jgi:general secretion pathway protein A
MYNTYFGFTDSPFENNLDQRFLFFSANHKEVTAALLYFIKWKKGFALVCGDVGTGKTMLINYLLNKLPASVCPIMIANPDVGYVEILRYVAGILKIDADGKGVLDLVDQVKAALVEASRQGKRFVLIIDEAHLLSDKTIEQIRLLSNIETQEHKLFQILLLGQYELSYKLNRPEMRQLRQRININRFLAPMDADETIQYIDHRLKMAGAGFDACFEPQCRQLIFKMTGGVPRSINQLCDSALLICAAEKLPKVNRKALKKAGTALRSDVLFTPAFHAGRTRSSWKGIRILAACCTCAVILILLGISGYRGGLGERAQYFLHSLHSSMLTPPVAVRQPVPEPAANPAMPPEAVKPDDGSAKMPASATATAAETAKSGPDRMPAGALSNEENPQAVPKAEEKPIKESVLPSFGTKIQLAGPQVHSDSGAALPAMKQAPKLQDPIKVKVKNGDTLIGIASRFFPEDKVNGMIKILAANPMIDDMDRIYTGQELIIPEAGSYGKEPN